jgi:hypothetical protein
MSARIAPLAAAGLAALAAANVWLLTVVLANPSVDEPAGVAAPAWSPKPSSTGGTATAKPLGAYRETLAQPVFFKTREPYVAPARPAPPPPTPAVVAKPPPPVIVDPGLAVTGIIISPGVRKAYLHGKTDPRGNWVSEGETLTGWKVQTIEPGGVKLQQQDRTIELQLYPVK